MPHLVSNFLRNTSGPIPHIKSVSRSRNTSRSNSRNPSRNTSPHASDGEDRHPVKLPDLAEAVKKHHLLSLHFGRSSSKERHHHHHNGSSSSSSSSSHSHSQQANAPVTIDWSIESPPIVFHGSPDDSTGALVSGQLFLDVKEDVVDVEAFSANLGFLVAHKRPFQSGCADCQTQTNELQAWTFLAHPTALRRGKHQFPFSVLLPGHLPACMDTPLVSIAYKFKAEAVITRTASSPCAGAGPAASTVKFERPLDVKRSLPEPLYPHNSVRVFPPTNIKAGASYTSVIHPNGNNRMTLKLDGLMSHNEKVKTVDLWKLKKLTWKLEETIKTVAPACEKHNPGAAESSAAAAAGATTTTATTTPAKGLPRSETRIIGEKSMHDGWKSDYSGSDGIVDVEFDFCVNQLKPHSSELKYACDTRTKDGTEVTHSLMLELVVSKEYAPEGKTHMSHQTGTGRILRMHFAVVLTHNGGLGISWDNEAPPVYQDVPPSPPGYYQVEEGPIEYDDLEELDAARGVTAPSSRRCSQGEL